MSHNSVREPSIQNAVARVIRKNDGTVIGAAFRIGRYQALTCSHVVNTALGRPQVADAPPDDQDVVKLEFTGAQSAQRISIDAYVVAWLPYAGARARAVALVEWSVPLDEIEIPILSVLFIDEIKPDYLNIVEILGIGFPVECVR